MTTADYHGKFCEITDEFFKQFKGCNIHNFSSLISEYCKDHAPCHMVSHPYSKKCPYYCTCSNKVKFIKVFDGISVWECSECKNKIITWVDCNNYDEIYKHHKEGKPCFCYSKTQNVKCPWYDPGMPKIPTKLNKEGKIACKVHMIA